MAVRPRRSSHVFVVSLACCWATVTQAQMPPTGDTVDFTRDIQPILAGHCAGCHGGNQAKGGLRLDDRTAALAGGNSGVVVIPAKSAESELLRRVMSSDPSERMPPKGVPLTASQIDLLRRWIDQGAPWPESATGPRAKTEAWWSLRPLARPKVPPTPAWGRNPIDAFVAAKLVERGLSPSPEADRRSLIRRVTFDLIGLPPTPEEVEAFVRDTDPLAYEKLVDRLLASPHHGERWARHWLDVVHYGDTHGYDKDKPRPNAWPYRDYVIRALNQDKPYTRFVEEQLAGDVLYPDTEDGITALGFIAAGPWDFIGHAELPESKLDGKLARVLDRDDMVATTLNTFCSLTVQCARCHHHKFDPVTQEHYYRLHAVFAALDRADRTYDPEPHLARQRRALSSQLQIRRHRQATTRAAASFFGGIELALLDAWLQAARAAAPKVPAAFGFHSAIARSPAEVKWVQIDMGKTQTIHEVVLYPCHDDFNNIGAGFGFPVRYKVEASDDPDFRQRVAAIADRTANDQPNPGLEPQRLPAPGTQARYLRITATRLAARLPNDFIFALAEVQVKGAEGKLLSQGARVSALDAIEAPPRWRKANLVDGQFPVQPAIGPGILARLEHHRSQLWHQRIPIDVRVALERLDREVTELKASLAALPPPRLVYAGTVHHGTGAFAGTGADGGRPRPIHVLLRGDVRTPGKEVEPGTVPLLPGETGRFDLPRDHTEGDRRAALARWITRLDHPLTWRSIVNRVWHYHFGRGLVDSPNDFGRMGQTPSHPELLDWLAVEFRDGGQSFKRLHRLIVTSATYRQVSAHRAQAADIDADNTLLWRMNRRRLSAEEIRDSILAVSGQLDRKVGGPPFQDFVIEKPEHSPHYLYHLAAADDPKANRRSVYRFLVRSQPQPFMTTLDCADPSLSVDKRNETLTALQALALLNNRLVLIQARYFADRAGRDQSDASSAVRAAFRLALQREPSHDELAALTEHHRAHGLPSVCRVLFNLNEFIFVD